MEPLQSPMQVSQRRRCELINSRNPSVQQQATILAPNAGHLGQLSQSSPLQDETLREPQLMGQRLLLPGMLGLSEQLCGCVQPQLSELLNG